MDCPLHLSFPGWFGFLSIDRDKTDINFVEICLCFEGE
jgi:hypothetical protein